jgi:cobalt-zinc-cadmium efflux system outer membrane protein
VTFEAHPVAPSVNAQQSATEALQKARVAERLAEGMARQQRIEFELEASRRALAVEVRAAFDAYERRIEAVTELERGALPALADNESLARRSYDAGQLSLAELLSIRRETVDTRKAYVDRLHDAALAGVELEAAAGVLQ